MRTFGIQDVWFILQAAQWTVMLSLIAFIGGTIGGLLVALARTSDNVVAQRLATAFIQVFQGTPLLMQLFLVFFGAPVIGLDISPWVAAGLALVLNTSAFLGEIWRGRAIQRARQLEVRHPRDRGLPLHLPLWLKLIVFLASSAHPASASSYYF